MDKKYEAIIDQTYPVPSSRAKMPVLQRAAQFAPFAALTGYEDVLAETARRTEMEICLDEAEKANINRRLSYLKEHLEADPSVTVKAFFPDDRKAGGSYRTIHSRVVKIDEYRQEMRLENGENIPFENIMQLLIL